MKQLLSFLTIIMAALLLKYVPASASDTPDAAPSPKEIYTVSDMLSIADDPSGSYILMADLDMKGVAWPAITFTGSFDGNQHLILNLDTAAVSEETRVTYDGNRKIYDTHFCGLFAILEHATVENVRLLNIDLNHTFTGDCFLGGIAGYASESNIRNCEITGRIRLDITGHMIGVGGILGYGNGTVQNCRTELTLVNIDLDKSYRDEQFLGGVCAAGYPDIEGCEINLSGFISDHGYVHSGGLVGMYIIYPKRFERDGYIKNNTVDGFITFFEDNTNRRAYCEARCGEIMDWKFKDSGNVYHFKRDERYTYTVNLLPHSCETPVYDEVVLPPTCKDYGYTYYTCKACGYSYKDAYVLPCDHQPGEEPTSMVLATTDAEGYALYECIYCQTELRIVLPQLIPSPTPVPTIAPTPTTAPTAVPTSAAKDSSGNNRQWMLLSIGLLLLFVILLVRVILRQRRMHKQAADLRNR